MLDSPPDYNSQPKVINLKESVPSANLDKKLDFKQHVYKTAIETVSTQINHDKRSKPEPESPTSDERIEETKLPARSEIIKKVEEVFLNDEQKMQQETKRKRNRDAAQRCRSRKNNKISDLEKQVIEQKRLLQKMMENNIKIEEENDILRDRIRHHIYVDNCQCGAFSSTGREELRRYLVHTRSQAPLETKVSISPVRRGRKRCYQNEQ